MGSARPHDERKNGKKRKEEDGGTRPVCEVSVKRGRKGVWPIRCRGGDSAWRGWLERQVLKNLPRVNVIP